MKTQHSESLDRLGEQVSEATTNAISDAINTDAIAKAIDTNAVAKAIDTDAIAKAIDTDTIINAITTAFRKASLTKKLTMEASIIGEKIGEKIGESVLIAIKSAMTISEPKASMDATAMREQTLGSLPCRPTSTGSD